MLDLDNLIQNISATLKAASSLSALQGRFYFALAPSGTPTPYAVLSLLDSGDALPTGKYAIGGQAFDAVYVQLAVYHNDNGTAQTLAKSIADLFHGSKLNLTGQNNFLTLRKRLGGTKDPNPDADGKPLYQAWVVIEFDILS